MQMFQKDTKWIRKRYEMLQNNIDKILILLSIPSSYSSYVTFREKKNSKKGTFRRNYTFLKKSVIFIFPKNAILSKPKKMVPKCYRAFFEDKMLIYNELRGLKV